MADRDLKIAVVGAGVAGLSAAYLLKKAGYSNVTVFEKEDRLGGKCRTVKLDGRTYELGAVAHIRGFEPVESFIREFETELVPGITSPVLFDPQRGKPYKYPHLLQALVAGIRFTLIARRRPELCCEGHDRLTADLVDPLSPGLETSRLGALERLFAAWMSAYGYGHAARIPAAYALKFCKPRTIWAVLRGGGVGFRYGYQNLWERVGSMLDVRRNHAIRRITRRDRVLIETEGDEFEFDRLILCCDLRSIAPALDLDEEEVHLIGCIRNYTYYSVLAEVEGFPSPAAFISPEFSPEVDGALVGWLQRWTDGNIYNIYANATDEISEEEVHRKIAENIRQVGAKLVRIACSKGWNYFPHVSSSDLKAGFYTRLEGRQGFRNTFYAGEIMHFSCTDLSAAYSASLVRKHFA